LDAEAEVVQPLGADHGVGEPWPIPPGATSLRRRLLDEREVMSREQASEESSRGPSGGPHDAVTPIPQGEREDVPEEAEVPVSKGCRAIASVGRSARVDLSG